jgi:hemolysin activation/secretion protein
MYGLGFKSEKLDYRLNPRKGFRFNCAASAGSKKINKNPVLNEKIYENIVLNSVQYNGQLAFDVFIPLFKKSTLNIATEGGSLLGNTIFRNELYRIGGLISIRGFDEESINASSFVINTIEYRFLYEQNSSVYFFSDFGWYENNSMEKYIKDYPIGFGAGISFQTKAGIFSINYALGKQFDNPVLLRAAKIHFGLVNFF